MENIELLDKTIKELEQLLKDKRWDLIYWNKRIDQTRGTVNLEPNEINKRETELEIECIEARLKELKDLVEWGEKEDEKRSEQYCEKIYDQEYKYGEERR